MHHGGTVPPLKMHHGGTVPPFKMHHRGTVPPFKMHHGGTIHPWSFLDCGWPFSLTFPLESGCLGVEPKVQGQLNVTLNVTLKPIVNKYGYGRLKRTMKIEFISTWNCVVVNGGFSQTFVGNSALVSRGSVVSNQQWQCYMADVSLGCISLQFTTGTAQSALKA